MKRHLLFKSLLLLCALIVGTNAWADSYTITFANSASSATGITTSTNASTTIAESSRTYVESKPFTDITGKAYYGDNSTSIRVGKSGNSASVTIALSDDGKKKATSIVVNCFKFNNSNAGTLAVNGMTEQNVPTSSANNLTFTFASATDIENIVLSVTKATFIYSITVNYTSGGGGSSTYTVTYNGNGNTGGTVPTDATEYASGASVTVLGNTGNLVKTNHTFSGWNTQPDGNGTDYSAGASFSIAANTTLYAKWTDNRTSAGLAWSATSASVKYGANNNVFPTLTNTHDVDVTYTSLDHSVATIDENGIITLKNITKSTTISAIFAGDENYLPQTVTYTLNVNYAIEDGVFDFVNAGKASPLVDYNSGVSITSDGNYYEPSDATWTAGNVTMVTSGKYRWWYNGCELKLYSNTPKSAATFSVPNGYVITKIVTTGGNFTTITSGEGNLSGNTWTGASQSVKLSIGGSTVSFKTITVTYTTPKQTITPSYDKITYVTPYMMNFNNIEGLKAYVATSANASGVTMTSVEGAVPENTPLLLIGTANDSYEVPVAASATAPATNLLKKGDGTTVFDGSTYDYILYSDGKFYQIGSGTVATNKAYLHLDAAPSGARSLDIVFDDNETTGVNEVKTQKATGEYFNLAGQRVAQPTKGLYIVNGKKVIIK